MIENAPENLTGMEPALGGELRPGRAAFAPWPYPESADDLIAHFQGVSIEEAQTSIINTVPEEMHAHIIAATIATMRDPHSDTNLRQAAAVLLDGMLTFGWFWEHANEQVVGTLNHLLTDKDYLVRYHVASALTRIEVSQGNPPPDTPPAAPGDVDTLIAALREGTVLVRQHAAAALAGLRASQSTEPLVAALDRERDAPAVRLNVIRALGNLGAHLEGEQGAQIFARLLNLFEQEDNARLCEAAAEAMGNVGAHLQDASSLALKARAVELLTTALDTGTSYLRQAAIEALEQIGAQAEAAALRARAIDPLIAALRQKPTHYTLRCKAAEALGEAGAHLQDAALMTGVVEVLIIALGDNVPEVRCAAAGALGQIGARPDSTPHRSSIVAPLTAALNDRHANVRDRAAEALRRIGAGEGRDRG